MSLTPTQDDPRAALVYRNRLGPLLVTFRDGSTLRVPARALGWYDPDEPPGFMEEVKGGDYEMRYVEPADVASAEFDPAPDPDTLAVSEGRIPDWIVARMRAYPDLYVALARVDPGYIPVLIDRARESDACPPLPGEDCYCDADDEG